MNFLLLILPQLKILSLIVSIFAFILFLIVIFARQEVTDKLPKQCNLKNLSLTLIICTTFFILSPTTAGLSHWLDIRQANFITDVLEKAQEDAGEDMDKLQKMLDEIKKSNEQGKCMTAKITTNEAAEKALILNNKYAKIILYKYKVTEIFENL
jgi:hypothetical protein